MTLQGRNYTPRPKTGMPQKKPYPGLKRTAIKRVSVKKQKEDKEDGGLIKLFVDIWTERKPGSRLPPMPEITCLQDWMDYVSPYRVCFVTLEPIINMVPGNFLHVLTKNHSKWKKNPRNIVLGTFAIHQLQEFRVKNLLIEAGPGGFWFWELRDLLKQEYEHGPL